MEKPLGIANNPSFLNNISLLDLPQKEIVILAKKVFNGSSRDLTFRVETNLEKCRLLWNEFSPNESLFDLWDFRLAFWRGYQYQPYFITLSFQEKTISLLPLWFDKEDNQYTWFGGSWHDENIFFTKSPKTIPLLLKLVPGKTKLFCIRSQEEITDCDNFLETDEEKYVLNLKNFSSIDNFWEILKKKRRYNLKRDWKKIQALNPKIIINDFSHLENLFKLNINRFEGMVLSDNKSSFLTKEKQKTFREIINLAKDYQVRMISTVIRGQVVAVDLVALYHQVYYCLAGGCDVGNYSGLGGFANLQLIKDAIEMKNVDLIDFLQGDVNWKNSWRLEKRPLFKFSKEL
jgi:hypothetical protein